MTPLLAEIVAFLDTNNNTLILESSEENWLTYLWLGIFNRIDVEDIEKTTSGEFFYAHFPFSWLIYGAVEKILYVTSENEIGTHIYNFRRSKYSTNLFLFFQLCI